MELQDLFTHFTIRFQDKEGKEKSCSREITLMNTLRYW